MCEGYLKFILLSVIWISPLHALSGKIVDKYTKRPVEGALVFLQQNPFHYDSTDANGNFNIQSGLTSNSNLFDYPKNESYGTRPANVFLLNGRKIDNNSNVHAAHGLYILRLQENKPALFLQNKFTNQHARVVHSIASTRKIAIPETNDTLIFRANGYATQKLRLHNLIDGIQLEMDTSSTDFKFEIGVLGISIYMYEKPYWRDTVHLYAYVLPSKKSDTTLCTVSVSTTDPFTRIVKNQNKTYRSNRLQRIEFSVLFDKQMPPAHFVPFDFQYKTDKQIFFDSYYFLANPFTLQDFSIVTEKTTFSTVKPDGILNCGERIDLRTCIKNETDFPVQSLEIRIEDTLFLSTLVKFGSFKQGESKIADSMLTISTSKESPDSVLKLNMFAQSKINEISGIWVIPIEIKARLDLSPPVIDLKSGKHLKVETLQGFMDPGVTAIDAFDGDCSKRVTVVTDTFINVLLIKYSATDLDSHAVQRERTVAIGTVPLFEKYNLSEIPPLSDINCELNSLTIEGDGPDLSLVKSIKVNYNKNLNALFDFSIVCNSSPFYSGLVGNSTFYLNEPLPEVIIKNSKIQGLDGSYYLHIGSKSSGTTLTLISKTGLFAIRFES